MARIYTRTGDEGATSLGSGERVSKGSLRVEAYGAADELQAALGAARAFVDNDELNADLKHLEELLVTAMADLARSDGECSITDEELTWIEDKCDEYSPEKFSFLIFGDDVPSSFLNVARTTARHCERCVIRLSEAESVCDRLLMFFNRISDLCYSMASSASQR